MPVYHNVTAAIYVDGRALDEYQVEHDDSKKLVSCWIPSQVGKEFSIQVRNTSLNDYFQFTVEMDGDFTNYRDLDPQAIQHVDRCRPGPTTYRTFVFSKGQPVGDDEVSVDLTRVAGIGTIALKVSKGHRGSWKINLPSSRDIRIPEERRIPERAKKAVDTCIALGPVKTRPPENMYKEREFITTGFHADFVFRYRPLGMLLNFLRAQGIAPPPPATSAYNASQVNSTRKRKRSLNQARPEGGPSQIRHSSSQTSAVRDILGVEINAEQPEQDLEKLRALRSKIDQILAKKDPRVRPKKEYKSVLFAKGKVIDLT